MRTLQASFEEFEKAKVKFAQQLADFAAKSQNIDNLYSLGALKQLRALLIDPTVSVQNSAALALGRIANHSEKLAEAVVENQVLPQLVVSLGQQNVHQALPSPSTKKLHASCSGLWPSIPVLSPNRL